VGEGRGGSKNMCSGFCLGWQQHSDLRCCGNFAICRLPQFPKMEVRSTEVKYLCVPRTPIYSRVCLSLIFCFSLCKIWYLKPEEMVQAFNASTGGKGSWRPS